mmetsp:Transcript_5159/g.15242  ORF Transcript_5159/g.15242 Transcript_5159/m.15242 type:complete len:398 (+) Transcript_5159:520-1713(+)
MSVLSLPMRSRRWLAYSCARRFELTAVSATNLSTNPVTLCARRSCGMFSWKTCVVPILMRSLLCSVSCPVTNWLFTNTLPHPCFDRDDRFLTSPSNLGVSTPSPTVSSTRTPSRFSKQHISGWMPKPSTWMAQAGSLPTPTVLPRGSGYIKHPDNNGSSQTLTRYGSASSRIFGTSPRDTSEANCALLRPKFSNTWFRRDSKACDCAFNSSLVGLKWAWSSCAVNIFSTISCLRSPPIWLRFSFSCSISARSASTSDPSNSSFLCGLVRTFFAELAKWTVDAVMASLDATGATHARSTVLQLPINASESKCVNLLLLQGMWTPLAAIGPSRLSCCSREASLEIMRLKADRLLLISLLSRCLKCAAPAFARRSEPARSTACSCALRMRRPRSRTVRST